MAEQGDHGIAWTETTWNPVRGCSRVSEGCRNCYAERVAARFSGPGLPYEGLAKRVGGEARWTGKVVMVPEHLADPLRWKRPRRVFVNSMSDLFHEGLSDEQIDQVFAVMALAGRHTFQVLTKRAERMREYLAEDRREEIEFAIGTHAANWGASAQAVAFGGSWFPGQYGDEGRCELAPCFEEVRVPWPLPNVWLGVSVEDQETADERIPLLLETPAAVRWVSYEPALGMVDFRRWLTRCWLCPKCGWAGELGDAAWRGIGNPSSAALCATCGAEADANLGPALDWIVVGGESGRGARPFDLAWARTTVEQCKAAGVACFVKQLGARPIKARDVILAEGENLGEPTPWTLHRDDTKGGNFAWFPPELRVREYPATP